MSDRPSTSSNGKSFVAVLVDPIRRFLATETSGARLLFAATLVALVWANSPWHESYERVWDATIALGGGPVRVARDARHWINDVLMTLFFLVVGLEIKRELASGELSSPRKALLPVLAALGGMVLPAALFLAVTAGTDAAGGWGIPMATDVAFAVGALAAFGRGLPSSLRVFLLSLAIVDDIGAILVIAFTYSGGVHWGPLVAVGVALALPAGRLGTRLEHRLHPWTSYLIVPLFALANAGVALSGDAIPSALTSRLGLGIVVGLVVGKLGGISLATLAGGRAGLALPEGAKRGDVAGVAALAGIGFTVSLFIADLAFAEEAAVARAKVGILVGSTLAAIGGALILRAARSVRAREGR